MRRVQRKKLIRELKKSRAISVVLACILIVLIIKVAAELMLQQGAPHQVAKPFNSQTINQVYTIKATDAPPPLAMPATTFSAATEKRPTATLSNVTDSRYIQAAAPMRPPRQDEPMRAMKAEAADKIIKITATRAPRFSLMPVDFLKDDLTGKYAQATQRLLRKWGFQYFPSGKLWQTSDTYALKLYQRWAGLKPTGKIDNPTRKSLLATWQKAGEHPIRRKTLPLEGKYIGINPGHQNKNFDNAISDSVDPRYSDITIGTWGRTTGIPEYALNLTVALKLRDALEAQGARVLLSRLTNDIRISNYRRTALLNSEKVDVALLIHADGNHDPGLAGLHMIASSNQMYQRGKVLNKSLLLANTLQTEELNATAAKDRGVGQRDNLTNLLSLCHMPVALIEMGYMTNKNEDRLLNTAGYQKKLVDGLVKGFLRYFSLAGAVRTSK